MNINNEIKVKLANHFGGSERKLSVILSDGEMYLLKLPDPIREKGRTLSYINNAFSEYLGCRIIKSMGFDVQDVKLGEYTADNGKTYIACACKNIVPEGYVLAEAANTILEDEDSFHTSKTASFDMIDVIANNVSVDNQKLSDWYYDLFVADALIGNTDRHNGNWGFLTGINGTMIAPVYDCGSSLSPLLSDEDLSDKMASYEAQTTVSAIKYKGKKETYYNIFRNLEDENIIHALCRVLPKINMPQIYAEIDKMPYISDVRKKYYEKLLTTRYEKILLPALMHGIETMNQNAINIVIEKPYFWFKQAFPTIFDAPVYFKIDIVINDKSKQLVKASKKYVIIIDNESGFVECVLSLARHKDLEQSLKIFSGVYNIAPEEIPQFHFGVNDNKDNGDDEYEFD